MPPQIPVQITFISSSLSLAWWGWLASPYGCGVLQKGCWHVLDDGSASPDPSRILAEG